MNITALATHARQFVEREYHATISTQDAFLVASAAANYTMHKGDYPDRYVFIRGTQLAGRPPLEDAFFYLVSSVLAGWHQ